MAQCVIARSTGRNNAFKGVVAGLAGGLVGSWTMNRFQAVVSRATADSPPGDHSKDEPSADRPSRPEDEDATHRVAQALAERTIDRRLSKDELQVAGPVVHYTYGTLMGGLYGALAERSRAVRSLAGTAYGATLWAAGDEVAVPLFGLSRPSTEYPVSTHAQAFAAHIVYGVTTELVRRGLRAAL